MGRPDFVPAERYYDRTFADLERDRLWPRVWQMACRLEEIPAVGDYVEYTICDQSLLVVRVDDQTVRAYFNACRHRATELAKGTGSFAGGRIICPFHGWRWDLEGRNSFVYGAHAFDQALLEPEDVVPQAGPVDLWGACAWVNLDPAAPPLLDALDPIPSLLDPLGVADMRVHWWKKTVLPANWKMAQEAFMEGYHVPQTHPQLTLGHPEQYDPDSLVYSVYDRGHSSFQLRPNAQAKKGQQVGVGRVRCDRRVGAPPEQWARGHDAPPRGAGGRGDAAPDDPRREHVRRRAGQGHLRVRRRCRDPAPARPIRRRWPGGAACSSCSPTTSCCPSTATPSSTGSDRTATTRSRASSNCGRSPFRPTESRRPRPVVEGPYAPDDTDHWPRIPLQDFSNIGRQQRGIHTQDFEGLRLSHTYEAGIATMHLELDRYLAWSRDD